MARTRTTLLLGATFGALAWWATRPAPPRPAPSSSAPDPFPFRPIPRPERPAVGAARAVDRSAVLEATPDDAGWVAPDADGACPLSHPVKANAGSRIFHVPGGQSYERTRAERCYATADAAVADGFRAAKR